MITPTFETKVELGVGCGAGEAGVASNMRCIRGLKASDTSSLRHQGGIEYEVPVVYEALSY
jgi:hypothetical protein